MTTCSMLLRYCSTRSRAERWIRTIKIRDTLPKVSQINKDNRDLYINFNYTATLEKVYGISDSSVIHIHGSLRDYTDDPVLGHGNLARIEAIGQKQKSADFAPVN